MSGPNVEQTTEPGEAAATDVVVAGPFKKDAEHYLSSTDWYGQPVPPGRIGAWGLGFTCWYYRAEVYGDRLFFAAETAEVALNAAARALVAAAEERGFDRGVREAGGGPALAAVRAEAEWRGAERERERIAAELDRTADIAASSIATRGNAAIWRAAAQQTRAHDVGGSS